MKPKLFIQTYSSNILNNHCEVCSHVHSQSDGTRFPNGYFSFCPSCNRRCTVYYTEVDTPKPDVVPDTYIISSPPTTDEPAAWIDAHYTPKYPRVNWYPTFWQDWFKNNRPSVKQPGGFKQDPDVSEVMNLLNSDHSTLELNF